MGGLKVVSGVINKITRVQVVWPNSQSNLASISDWLKWIRMKWTSTSLAPKRTPPVTVGSRNISRTYSFHITNGLKKKSHILRIRSLSCKYSIFERYGFVVYRRSIANRSSEANLHINSRNKFISVPFSGKQRLKRQILNTQQSLGLDKIRNSTWHDFPIQLRLIELEWNEQVWSLLWKATPR